MGLSQSCRMRVVEFSIGRHRPAITSSAPSIFYGTRLFCFPCIRTGAYLPRPNSSLLADRSALIRSKKKAKRAAKKRSAMGGGNGQKSKVARERNMEKNKPAKGSQLESNKKSMTIQCKVCMQTFMCTTSEVKCREHAEAKHPKNDLYQCFPHLKQ